MIRFPLAQNHFVRAFFWGSSFFAVALLAYGVVAPWILSHFFNQSYPWDSLVALIGYSGLPIIFSSLVAVLLSGFLDQWVVRFWPAMAGAVLVSLFQWGLWFGSFLLALLILPAPVLDQLGPLFYDFMIPLSGAHWISLALNGLWMAWRHHQERNKPLAVSFPTIWLFGILGLVPATAFIRVAVYYLCYRFITL